MTGEPLRLLEGVPFTAKDIVNTKGGGVRALISSHGLPAMYRKRCGRRLSPFDR